MWRSSSQLKVCFFWQATIHEFIKNSVSDVPLVRLQSMVQPKVKDAFGYWIMSTRSARTLLKRHVDCESFYLDELLGTAAKEWSGTNAVTADESPEANTPCKRDLLIVSGESGSGKTYSVLRLLGVQEIGVYLTALDFDRCKTKEEKTSSEGNDARNAHARGCLIEILEDLLTKELMTAIRDGNYAQRNLPKRFLIVIDEVGEKFHLVRALCKIAAETTLQLDAVFGGLRVDLVAIGTGIDCNVAAPGSHPENYRIVRLPTDGRVWQRIVEMARSSASKSTDVVCRFIEQLGEKLVLAGNSRVAALVYKLARAYSKALLKNAVTRRRCARHVVPTFLTQVVLDFKSRNGMEGADLDDVLRDYMRCAHVILYAQRDDISTMKLAAQSDVVALLRNKGVLTDNAFWSKDGVIGDSKVLQADNDLRLHAPYDAVRGVFSRFAMSAPQLELFRMNYGFNMPLLDWDGFELAAMQYLEFVLVGARDVELGRVLRLLDLPASGELTPAPDYLELMDTMNFSKVRVLHCAKAIAPVLAPKSDALAEEAPTLQCQEVLDEIAGHVRKKEVVIVRNAAMAPFADILVFLPKIGVVLVQNKFYGEGTQFTAEDAEHELVKMGAYCQLLELSSAEVASVVSMMPRSTVERLAPKQYTTPKTVKRQAITEAFVKGNVPAGLAESIAAGVKKAREGQQLLDAQLRRCCAGHAGVPDVATSSTAPAQPPGGPLSADTRPSATTTTTTSGAPSPWVKFCLMTTKERVAVGLPGVLQFQATAATMNPVKMPEASAVHLLDELTVIEDKPKPATIGEAKNVPNGDARPQSLAQEETV